MLKRLLEGATALGLALTERQLDQFDRYLRLLLDWNQRVNLTAITEPQQVEVLHFLDSLSVLEALPSTHLAGWNVVDIGAGAGFPGLPLKLVRPGIRLTLVESVGKKAAFLNAVVKELALEGVTVVNARSETLGQDPAYRERFDLALARAVAELPALVEMALPLCKVGGLLIAQKKGDIQPEVAASAGAMRTMGGSLREVRPVQLALLPPERSLVIIDKAAATPPSYPRRPGMAEKRPLR